MAMTCKVATRGLLGPLSRLAAAGLLPARAEHILKAQGAAARPSSGSTAAGRAPAPTRLVDSAAKLRPVADKGAWELCYSDKSLVYIDSVGVVDRIRSWARSAREAAACDTQAIAPAPLLISGLIKTGKSFTQEHVVPAVVAEELCRRGEAGSWANMVVLRLKADSLCRQEGATVMLRSLLRVLLTWARNEHVPMREGALQAAEAVLASQFNSKEPEVPGFAISDFFDAVEVPVLVLCDGVQNLFLPNKGGELDRRGAEYVRDSFMKHLLLYGRRTTLWCLTGSYMAHTWISLASMPPNGYAMVNHTSTAVLPAANSQEDMKLAWEILEDHMGQLDRELWERCSPSVALLMFLVLQSPSSGDTDVAEFVRIFMWTVLEQSRREWQLALEGMPLAQRRTVMDLALPGVGAQIDEMHRGLWRYLEPHLEETADGCRYYLRDPHQRQILRLIFNKDGSMRDSWSDMEFSATLTQLDGGWVLVHLGETADYLLGPSAKRRWKDKELPAGSTQFMDEMQTIAVNIASKLEVAADGGASSPRELWEQQPWFKRVLDSEWNSADRNNEQDRKALCTHLDMLVFYLRMSRNVLAHMKPWNLAHNVMVDVSVIEALPSALGLSVSEFTAVLVQALRGLPRATVMEAMDAYKKQPSGSGGGATTASNGLSSSTNVRGRNTRAAAGKCALPHPRAQQ